MQYIKILGTCHHRTKHHYTLFSIQFANSCLCINIPSTFNKRGNKRGDSITNVDVPDLEV